MILTIIILILSFSQHREDEITVTLWGDQAHKFEELKPEFQKPNVILIVSGTKAVTFKGKLHSTTACFWTLLAL